MATGKEPAVGVPEGDGGEAPRSVGIASRGIRTAGDAANFLSALIGDVMTEAVPTKIANTACNGMGKLLKVVDMQQRYGKPKDGEPEKMLVLADPTDARRAAEQTEREQLLARLAELDGVR